MLRRRFPTGFSVLLGFLGFQVGGGERNLVNTMRVGRPT